MDFPLSDEEYEAAAEELQEEMKLDNEKDDFTSKDTNYDYIKSTETTPEKFIPIRHLSYKELQLLRETEILSKKAKTTDELKYYEKVLDVLLASAVRRKREKETDND